MFAPLNYHLPFITLTSGESFIRGTATEKSFSENIQRRPVTDDIGTVGAILLCHAGSVKKMGAGLYIVTEDEGATVGIREG